MNALISRSTALVAVAITSLLAATPARAQRDERAIVAAVTTSSSKGARRLEDFSNRGYESHGRLQGDRQVAEQKQQATPPRGVSPAVSIGGIWHRHFRRCG